MSLNKILSQGKVLNGIDIKCSTISCSSTIDQATFTNGIIAGSSLFNQNVECFGEIKTEQFKLQQRPVILNGVLLAQDQNIVGEEGGIASVTTSENWTYQKYGDTLLLQGQFVAEFVNPSVNNSYVDIQIPVGFKITSLSGSTEVSTGSAIANGAFINNQPLVSGGASVLSNNMVRLIYVTADGQNPRVINTSLQFYFSIIIRRVFFV